MSMKRSRSRSPMDGRHGGSRDRSRSPRRPRNPTSTRVIISNIPYDLKWQEIKDLFRREVGDVIYVELFNGPDGKPKGSGVIEFKDIDTAGVAIEKMHRYEIKERKIVVREEKERERRQNNSSSMRGGGGGGGGMGMGGGGMSMGIGGGMGASRGGQGMMGPGPAMGMGGTSSMGSGGMGGQGLNPQVLQQLGIDGPLSNSVFVSNLDYKVGWKKLKDVFRLAGNVLRAEIKDDKDGKSRGMGTVTFETPAEAVQAVSMFNGQSLFDRTMRVKIDGQSSSAPRAEPLPSGLKSIGPSLNSLQMNTMDMGMGMGSTNMGMGGGMGGMDSLRGGGMGMGSMDMNRMGSAGMSSLGGMGSLTSGMGSSMNSSMSGMGAMSGMGSGMGSNMGMGDTFSGMSGMSGLGGGGTGMGGSLMGGGMSDSYGMSSMGMSGGGSSFSGMMDSSRGSGLGGYSSGGSSRLGDYGRDRSDRGVGNLPSGDMRTRADKSTIIVKNLPYSMDWQTLKSRFMAVGDIRFAEINKDDRGKSQGWGLISFKREEDARIAVQKMNRANLDGREVVVKMLS